MSFPKYRVFSVAKSDCDETRKLGSEKWSAAFYIKSRCCKFPSQPTTPSIPIE